VRPRSSDRWRPGYTGPQHRHTFRAPCQFGRTGPPLLAESKSPLTSVSPRQGSCGPKYLIGRAAGPRELAIIRAEIEGAPGVDELLDLLTMYLGPDHLIVAARVAFSDEISADRAENVADGIDRGLVERLPLVAHVFLDPTQTPSAFRPGAR
jgi:hypothetical protein